MAFQFLLVCLGMLTLSVAALILFCGFRIWHNERPLGGLFSGPEHSVDAAKIQKEFDAVRRSALDAGFEAEDAEEEKPDVSVEEEQWVTYGYPGQPREV